ncbi:MAG TPA: hypothetical protein VKU85_06570, partial [bacterium]|nr:hypothetical protein [bacterium]
FLSVSLALLGLGAPGVWFHRFPPRDGLLPASLIAAGVTVPGSIIVITQLMGSLRGPDVAPGEFWDASAGFLSGDVLTAVFTLLVPFLCLGATVCLLLLRSPGRKIGVMYGADLLGATVGAALIVPLMHRVPTPALIAGAGFLPLLAVPLVSRRATPWAGGLALVLAALLWEGSAFELHFTKKYAEGDRVLFEKWTPTGRITIFPDVFHLNDPGQAFAWGYGDAFEAPRVEQLWLEQDGSAGTPITRWTGRDEDLAHLFHDVTSFGYQLHEAGRVCVIGAGGGRDVLTALRAGAEHVDAVELNPHIIRAVSGPFAEYSGNPYGMPGVRAVENEGRSHLTRTQASYDLIQISMVDSWAATAAGAFSLSENFLYTEEAFRLYWNRLTDDGMVSFSRWFLDRHLVETARLVLLAQSALRKEGVEEPRRHMSVVAAGAVATLLVSKRPFTAEDLPRIDAICAERGFHRVWPPAQRSPQFAMIHRLLAEGPASARAMGLDLSPPRDDRPFFFQTVPVFGKLNRELVARLSVNEQSVALLRTLIVVVAMLTVALFFLPLVLGRAARRGAGFWPGSGFFACIGLAFLFVETAWIHRFILYLGHPSYATTVVLAAMLLGAGAGSLAASRVDTRRARTLLLALPVVVLALNATIGPMFTGTLGWPFAARVAASLALLLPPAFLMGFPFPLGMSAFGETHRPWFWAMNGAFSVLASVSSLALSMTAGYQAVAYAGAVIYVGAWLLFARRGAVEG